MWARCREQLGWVVLFRVSDLVVVKVSAAAAVLRSSMGLEVLLPGSPGLLRGAWFLPGQSEGALPWTL